MKKIHLRFFFHQDERQGNSTPRTFLIHKRDRPVACRAPRARYSGSSTSSSLARTYTRSSWRSPRVMRTWAER